MIVHRGLKALENERIPLHDADDVAALGTHCSTQEQQAEMAEKESIRLKLMHYYQGLLDEGNPGPFPGYVSAMNPRGLMVELEGTGVRGLVPFMMLANDYFEIDRDGIRARGRSSGQVISVGDQIEVGITKVDILRRLIDFAPWSAFGKGGKVQGVKGKSSGDKSARGGAFKGKRKTKGHSRIGEGKKAGKTEKRSGKKSGGKKRGR